MTPPSLSVAREILAHAATEARDDVAQAIRVVLDHVAARAALDQSVHGAASVITVSSPPAETAPTAILIGSIPGVRQILSREDAREAFGRQDGDAVWDAFGRAPTPPVFVAPVPPARAGCSEHACTRHPSCLAVTVRCGCPECQRATAAASAHGTAIPTEALVDDMLPCPFCRCATITVGVSQGETYPRAVCGECGARGPRARTSTNNREAIANWNRRPGVR